MGRIKNSETLKLLEKWHLISKKYVLDIGLFKFESVKFRITSVDLASIISKK